MDSIVVLLGMLAGGAVLAGILAFLVLAAVASLVEILPRGRWLDVRGGEPAAHRAALPLRGTSRAI
ncbi:MAG: hypothetical protein WAN26_05505, partial [Steroidobacteraceae bacterium]